MTKGKTMLDFTLTEEQCNIRDLAHDFAAAIVLGSRGLTGVPLDVARKRPPRRRAAR
jgi:hypothetical protein